MFSNCTYNSKKYYDNDYLLEELKDLVNVQFRDWYCKIFYILGHGQILRLAAIARVDATQNKCRYFSSLIKRQAADRHPVA